MPVTFRHGQNEPARAPFGSGNTRYSATRGPAGLWPTPRSAQGTHKDTYFGTNELESSPHGPRCSGPWPRLVDLTGLRRHGSERRYCRKGRDAALVAESVRISQRCPGRLSAATSMSGCLIPTRCRVPVHPVMTFRRNVPAPVHGDPPPVAVSNSCAHRLLAARPPEWPPWSRSNWRGRARGHGCFHST